MLNIKKYINKHEVQFCVENIDSSLFVKLNGRYKESNMSNHILFEITDGRFISENKYNAASKPRNDTITTAIRLGFKPFISIQEYWEGLKFDISGLYFFG